MFSKKHIVRITNKNIFSQRIKSDTPRCCLPVCLTHMMMVILSRKIQCMCIPNYIFYQNCSVVAVVYEWKPTTCNKIFSCNHHICLEVMFSLTLFFLKIQHTRTIRSAEMISPT